MRVKFSVLLKRFQGAILLLMVFLGLTVVIGCGTSSDNTPGVANNNVVVTEFGSVMGSAASGAWVYKGIPYAAPPVGALRWSAPQDPDSWTGVRDATQAANVCVQQIYSRQWAPATPPTSSSSYTGSEDCLYLDVYRPQTATTGLPVFVWIHGGANNFGGGTSYDGTTMAVRENMIVVVIQYRLASLGWFSNSSLASGEDALSASGNFGMLDQIKALNWVQNNVTAFGGDPAKVTVGGQSAGANATLNLVTSPLTTGLFSKAVAISPVWDPVPKTDTRSNAMIDWLLLDDGTVTPIGTSPHYNAGDWTNAANYRGTMSAQAIKTYLRSKAGVKIMAAAIEANYHLTGAESMPWHVPYADTTVLPAAWVTTIGTGNYRHVPLLIGNAEYESKSFLPLFGAAIKTASGGTVPSSSYTWTNLLHVLLHAPGYTLNGVLPLAADVDIYDKVGKYSSDMWKAKHTDVTARALLTNSASNSIYSYIFEWDGGGDAAVSDFQLIYGASHGMDVPFWFGTYETDLFGFSFTTTNRPGRVLLMNAMMDYLGAFVRTGDPNPAGSSLPVWPKWTLGSPNVQTLNATTTSLAVVTDTSYHGIGELTVANVGVAATTYEGGVAWGATLAAVLGLVNSVLQ